VPDLQPFQQRLRDSVWLALAEVAVVAGLFYADVHHHIYVSKTPCLWPAARGAVSGLRTQPRRACNRACGERYAGFHIDLLRQVSGNALGSRAGLRTGKGRRSKLRLYRLRFLYGYGPANRGAEDCVGESGDG
jgi:hypothetical protein